MVVLVGSNLAWCHPVIDQRLQAARAERGTRVVVIDPRATATCSGADLHLALAPGSDVALFNGLAAHLIACGACDHAYVERHTTGFAELAALVADYDLDRVTQVTGLSRGDVTAFYELFARHAATVTAWSQGVNQSSAGTDKVNAIINCHLLTGRVGRPGCGPFSLTGQPNAMGGRETGGLATTLAAHVGFDDSVGVTAVQAFWTSPRIARASGLKAVDLFDAVASGRIKALWIMATNPAVSMPDSARIEAALARCPTVIVSDITAETATARYADILLPAAGWGEKDGTVTNSERRVSRQRAFVAPPGLARPDWWMVSQVARRLGHASGFDYASAAEIFAEYAALTAQVTGPSRCLDLGALAGLDQDAYDALAPVQWPVSAGSAARGDGRLFGDGVFATADGRARLVASPLRLPAARQHARAPLALNSGRMRDQWHTMTRSARAARLTRHAAEPQVDVHPADAARFGLAAAELAEVRTATGRMLARVCVTERQLAGTIFAGMHWSAPYSSEGRVNQTFAAVTDPFSGQPELKHAAAALRRYPAAWFGFALTVDDVAAPAIPYWARMRSPGGWRLELADAQELDDARSLLQGLLLRPLESLEVLEYTDSASGRQRLLALRDGSVQAALFIAPEPVAVARAWACERPGQPPPPAARSACLAGWPATQHGDEGAVVCTCHGVGRRSIEAAVIAGHGNLGSVGRSTGAGTHCGSCRMEIRQIIDTLAVREAERIDNG